MFFCPACRVNASYLPIRISGFGLISYLFLHGEWVKQTSARRPSKQPNIHRSRLEWSSFSFWSLAAKQEKETTKVGGKIIIVHWSIEHSWNCIRFRQQNSKGVRYFQQQQQQQQWQNHPWIHYCPDSTEGSGDNVASHGCTAFYTVRFGGAFPGTSSDLNWGMTRARLLFAASLAIFPYSGSGPASSCPANQSASNGSSSARNNCWHPQRLVDFSVSDGWCGNWKAG